MLKFTKGLQQALEEQLNFINLETDDSIKKAEMSIGVTETIVAQLKVFIFKYKFQNQSEEIQFFKEIKPSFFSKLIFHITIYNIETKRPSGGDKVNKRYISNELDKLKRYFDDNLEFYKYYRTNSNYLDHKYFVRGKHDIRLSLDTFYFETDPKFSTSHDFKVSKILANDLIQVYLEDKILSIDRKDNSSNKTQTLPKIKLSWSDNKTDLIELIYALYYQGVFDNGKSDLKEIATYFEAVFNVDLGDYYRTYHQLRLRKNNRTKYLDMLKEKLSKRMNENDDVI